MANRDPAFDFVKGVLIYLVVYGHVLPNDVALNIIYSFHMPLFIFLSGYFATHTLQKSVGGCFEKVWNRLFCPALIWSGVMLGMFWLKGYERGLGSMLVDSLRSVWFLYCLASLYVLGCIVFKARRWKYVIAVGLAILGYVVYKAPGVVYIEYFQPIRQWPLFVMGFAYCEYKQKFASRQVLLTATIVSAVVYTGLMFWLSSNHPIEYIRTHENYLSRAVIYQFGAIAWFALFRLLYLAIENSRTAKFVSSLGRNTLGIYVIHGKIQLVIAMALSINIFEAVPYCISAAILTGLSYVATLLVKKSPTASKYLLGE